MSYRSFEDLYAAVRGGRRRTIALVAAQDADALEAVAAAHEAGLADAILVGDEARIVEAAASRSIDLAPFRIVSTDDDAASAATAVSLVRDGDADVLMKGLIPTSIFLRAVLSKSAGLRTGDILSHIAVTATPAYPKLMLITDGGITIEQGVHTKLEITRNAIEFCRSYGVEQPKVALLALVETLNPRLPETGIAAEVLARANGDGLGGAIIEGPVALDVALSADAARKKGLDSQVAGDADIFVGSCITAANHIVKALLSAGGARVGGVVVGARCPIVLLSRSDSSQTKMDSIVAALAAYA